MLEKKWCCLLFKFYLTNCLFIVIIKLYPAKPNTLNFYLFIYTSCYTEPKIASQENMCLFFILKAA